MLNEARRIAQEINVGKRPDCAQPGLDETMMKPITQTSCQFYNTPSMKTVCGVLILLNQYQKIKIRLTI